MTLLVGDSTIEESTVSAAKEKVTTERFTAVATGTVESIELYIVKAAVSEPEVGIWADSASSPGTLLGHVKKSILLTENQWVAFTGLSVAVTSGTVYWLGFVDAGAILEYKRLVGTVKNFRKSTTAHATLESSPTMEALVTPEKFSIQALGTEGAAVKEVAGTSKITFKDSGALSPVSALAGTSKTTFKDALALGVVAELSAASKVRFKDAATLSEVVALEGTTKVRFKDSVALIHTPAVAGATKVRFADSAQAETVANLLASTAVRFKAQAAVGVSASLAGSTRIRFASHAKVTLVESGGKRVAIFIFED